MGDVNFNELYIQHEELKQLFADHQTRTAERIAGLTSTIADLRKALEASQADRREAFTLAALTGLTAYQGNGLGHHGENAVRLADEAIAALDSEKSASTY